ncbi:uncharacterized protein [Physcomitrium patens]|uniref:DUF1754-domain-containing protein n=1 Tax=Physcomitrium patens TaxID=3218 RepID=A0A2K1JY68_PHYPA|nr:protein FAM32A-like [Physcomitrium patens]XP_024387502.1 protein FAM32A-like [Physcomitrium patens]XP_024387503.1 protein FAM32A-like [Physcomitrium patens]XP_024387504.1 protein FAM32A-like [Physcomitrium patens]XP_024387505.1 protein FAM32A-like [Physcomitrium patens]XP_024387506.1 protein FAM32A-like [Physcomitrium patens]PNR46469.1 hypothetical protein PHYPA_013588 [Physcomitrium patens]|eukprot:XP_024387501.1 protein FAM32A-like [Physcomitrella patens]
MSYNNVVGGKLKLKGKALDVKAGGMKKKKKRRDTQEQLRLLTGREVTEREENHSPTRSSEADPTSQGGDEDEAEERSERQQAPAEDHRTPAEKRYHEQKAKLEARRLTKVATKSHRQRVEEFNQYLANLSEHYDIPKVGPG